MRFAGTLQPVALGLRVVRRRSGTASCRGPQGARRREAGLEGLIAAGSSENFQGAARLPPVLQRSRRVPRSRQSEEHPGAVVVEGARRAIVERAHVQAEAIACEESAVDGEGNAREESAVDERLHGLCNVGVATPNGRHEIEQSSALARGLDRVAVGLGRACGFCLGSLPLASRVEWKGHQWSGAALNQLCQWVL